MSTNAALRSAQFSEQEWDAMLRWLDHHDPSYKT